MQAAWPATTSHPHLPTALAVHVLRLSNLFCTNLVLYFPKGICSTPAVLCALGAAQCKKDKLSKSVPRGGWPRWWKISRESHTSGWGHFVSSALRSQGWGAPSSQPTTSSRGASAQGTYWSALLSTNRIWGNGRGTWSHVRGISDWTLGKYSSLREWLVTGRGFPGKWSESQAHQNSRSTWMTLSHMVKL